MGYDSTVFIYDNGRIVKSESFDRTGLRSYALFIYNDNEMESEESWIISDGKPRQFSKTKLLHDNAGNIKVIEHGSEIDSFIYAGNANLVYKSYGDFNVLTNKYRPYSRHWLEYDSSRNYLSILPREPGFCLAYHDKNNPRFDKFTDYDYTPGDTAKMRSTGIIQYTYEVNSNGLPVKSFILDSTGKHLYKKYFYRRY